MRTSIHDVLTGLPNRRAFDERLASELAKVRRHGGELALCLVDLDRFKRINDTAGHAAGDAVLRAVGKHLSAIRCEDASYRIGGDEFALVLVAAYATGAERAIERLRRAIWRDPDCRGVGASAGIAGALPGDEPASLVARADLGLYDAKRAVAASAAPNGFGR